MQVVPGFAPAARHSPSSRSGRCKVGLIQTVLPGVKDSVLAKTVKVTEARLARSGSRVTAERRTDA